VLASGEIHNHVRSERELIKLKGQPIMDSAVRNRILVVDDDSAICELLTTKLKFSGFLSQSCNSAEAALKILEHETFDAIISDMNMAVMTGLELLAEVRRVAPHTAFLMATGVSDVAVGVTAMKQGAADYLLKPFQMEAVMVSLRRALEMKRMEAELEEYRQRLESMVEQRTKQLKAAMRRIELTYDETLEALAGALDLRDNDTAGHSRRVTLYSLEMAKRLNFSADQLKQLERGAYLHDIGKIGIPDSILLKPGKLTPEETAVMQTHVRIGYELMSRVAFLSSAAQIVLTHQECFDGTGYPQGLAGEEIPLGARIFAISDTMDAMMSDRPYRRGRPYAVARAEIAREAGKQFDPQVVEAFLSIPEEIWEKIRSEASRDPSEKRRRAVTENPAVKGEKPGAESPLGMAAQAPMKEGV
jgi:response regulator RpfG family c-di-GMP phosphodiesterase